jgi:hypothetical protein
MTPETGQRGVGLPSQQPKQHPEHQPPTGGQPGPELGIRELGVEIDGGVADAGGFETTPRGGPLSCPERNESVGRPSGWTPAPYLELCLSSGTSLRAPPFCAATSG